MKKTSTAAANRAALARRRQRVGADSTSSSDYRPERPAAEQQSLTSSFTVQSDPKRELATSFTSLTDKTPKTSNLDTTSERESSVQFVKEDDQHQKGRQEITSLAENQHITNNPQAQSTQRSIKPFTIQSDAKRESATSFFASLIDKTPTKSNLDTTSERENSVHFVKEDDQHQKGRQEIMSLAENQQIESDQQVQSAQRLIKTGRIVAPLQPQRLSEQLASVREKENIETMPAADEEFFEDPEPAADSSEVLDVTSLTSESSVALKTFSGPKTMKVEERDTKYFAELTGLGLAAATETFEIHTKSDNVIRYGQPVMLYSRAAKAYLGVRTKDRNEQNGISFELGFFRRQLSNVETWTILHGDRKLLVGSAVRSVKTPRGLTAAVRTGDPIILRNNFIGGLLSITSEMELSLVTQSYDSNSQSRDALLDRALRHYEIFPSNTELFQFWHSHTPPCPSWTHSQKRDDTVGIPQSVKHLSPLDQEKLLLDEVIGSLMGLNCNLIRRERGEFLVVATVDRSLRNLVNRILPISSGFHHVKSFLQQHQPGYEYGVVMQALCEEIDAIVGEYLCSVEALEIKYRGSQKVKLTMNHIFVELQQLASTIDLLQHVVKCAQDKIGGSLLNAIRELKMIALAGDVHKQALLKRLMYKASIPWMNMLSRWLKSGHLVDTCGEFMVARNRSEKTKVKGDNWNTLFSVEAEHVFRGAIASHLLEEQVLSTGKNWNAVHLCENVASTDAQDSLEVDDQILRYTGDPSALSTYIDKTHKRASSYLLQLMLGHFQVESTLLTLKRYFLLDQGDFLVHFMDKAGTELTKLVEDVSEGRTQHWLNMALQLTDATATDAGVPSSSSVPQPLTPQSIRCFFADESLDVMLGVREGEPRTPSRSPYGQVTGLTGMLAFSLDFPEVPFPTSLLLSNRNISSYQMLFRHIFYAKHIEQRLVGVWLDNQMMKEFQSIRGLLGPTFCLRQRMLHFIHNFIYYMMLEVIEPNWLNMMQAISKEETTDDLINLHQKFLERIMEDCLLTNAALFKSLAKIMSTCLTFSEQMRRFVETTGLCDDKKIAKIKRAAVACRPKATAAALSTQRQERQARLQKQANLIARELKNDTYKRMISRHEEVFDDNLDDFMWKLRTKVGHQSQIITNLCTRLDFNGFISGRSKRP